MAVEIAPREDVLQTDDIAVLDGLTLLIRCGLAMWTLDAPEIVVVIAFVRGDLLLT